MLWGLAGNDTLDGRGGGNDILVGGTGDDSYLYMPGDTITELADGGTTDTVLISYDGFDLNQTNFTNIEHYQLYGTQNLTLTGDGNDNWLNGNTGNNVINGGAGNDTIGGEAGNDTLYGGDGNDTVLGGDGNDIIVGGLGADTFFGGRGVDTYVYTDAGESTPLQMDEMVDWFGNDLIDLSAIDADPTTDGNQAFHWIDGYGYWLIDGGGDGTPGALWYYNENGDNEVFYLEADLNGDKVADLQIHLYLGLDGDFYADSVAL